MSTTAIIATSSVSSVDHALVKTAGGEYTSASVEANPALAAGLIKLKDGNYGEPIVAAADRYTGLTADLTSLKLGG